MRTRDEIEAGAFGEFRVAAATLEALLDIRELLLRVFPKQAEQEKYGGFTKSQMRAYLKKHCGPGIVKAFDDGLL